MKKICSKCKIEKDEKEFHKHNKSKSGLKSQCKICRKNDYTSPQCRKQACIIQRARHRKDPRYKMILHAKERAKRYNIPFNIIYTDFIVPEICPILNIPIIIGNGKCSENSPTLDRVIPNLGYVKGNVCVISNKANTMKQNMSIEDIKKIINYINSYECYTKSPT